MRTSGPGDSGTFCPANRWQARPPTTSRSAASAKGLSNLYDGLGAPSECDAGARNPLAERCLSWWEARRPGRRPERNSLRGPSLGPQARPNRATARQGPDRLAQIARSGALRPATMGSALTRSQEATFTRKSFRCWLRRRRADFDPPYREATSATPANGARAEQPRRGRRSRSKARAASMLRALTGEERNSSRSHCARDGHRFESPQLRSPCKPR
jgi:hypothetical protein